MIIEPPVKTLYEHCNNAYIQLIAFDPQLLIAAMKSNISIRLKPCDTRIIVRHERALS